MWIKFLCLLFSSFFIVDNLFATDKAINAAKDHFNKEKDLTWLAIVGGVVAAILIFWLLNPSRKKKNK